jgi:hypothetical protein
MIKINCTTSDWRDQLVKCIRNSDTCELVNASTADFQEAKAISDSTERLRDQPPGVVPFSHPRPGDPSVRGPDASSA